MNKPLCALSALALLVVATHPVLGSPEPEGPKIYISVDMEGIGALVNDQFSPGRFEYERGRKLMTDQVNAAIEGALEAGASQVLVSDSHGNAQNLIPDDLHEAALLIRSFPRPLLQMEGVDESFAGVIFIGYHPKEGTPSANLSHTIMGSKIFELRVNERVVSEAIFNAAVAGSMGVPVIMVAGDQNVAKEATETFGPVETASTKESIGWLSAMSRHPKLICEEIKQKAKRAVERIAEMRPFVLEPPLRMEVTFKNTYDAEAFSYLPWVERVDGKTILVEANEIVDLTQFITAMFAINRR